MKKIIISLITTAMCVFGAYADKSTQYKVYDVTMTLTTTKASGTTSTACGEEYTYRKKAKRRVYGVIAGCGCPSMAGDETCVNYLIRFWDQTTGTAFTNFTFKTNILQRIGKDAKEVEQVLEFTVHSPDGEKFNIILAGIGKYTPSKKGTEYDTINVSGNVAGWMDAPYLVTPGTCSACEATPSTSAQSAAVKICECECSISDTWDRTPVYGKYTFKYNKKKAQKCEKNGEVSAKTLGVPEYAW